MQTVTNSQVKGWLVEIQAYQVMMSKAFAQWRVVEHDLKREKPKPRAKNLLELAKKLQ